MLETMANTFITILTIIVLLVILFTVYVLFMARESFRALFKAVRGAWGKTYSETDMLDNIRYFEREGNQKSANYWRKELNRLRSESTK